MSAHGRRLRRGIPALAVVLAVAGGAAAAGSMLGASEQGRAMSSEIEAGPEAGPREHRQPADRQRARSRPRVAWRRSEAIGLPHAGRLQGGVKLPAAGRSFFTWDPIQRQTPSRGWRRWGTDDLVRTTLRVVRAHAAAHPNAPRVGIGDLSRPHGGDFGPSYGLPGHASHQNGLDVDLYYPRLDQRERTPLNVSQVDLRLSQELVDRFVRAGAELVFVGPSTGIDGPPGVVMPLANHDNHLHVRLPA
jgi:murein endopeptidase